MADKAASDDKGTGRGLGGHSKDAGHAPGDPAERKTDGDAKA